MDAVGKFAYFCLRSLQYIVTITPTLQYNTLLLLRRPSSTIHCYYYADPPVQYIVTITPTLQYNTLLLLRRPISTIHCYYYADPSAQTTTVNTEQ